MPALALAYPVHIICYYRETNEVHQSMDPFTLAFAPPLIAVCENVAPPNAVPTLMAYFEGAPLQPGVNLGRHRRSRAPFIIYLKEPHEPRGKRFSHSIGAALASRWLGDRGEEAFAVFQDADTASNPVSLERMIVTAQRRGADMVGASMVCANAVPSTVLGSFTSAYETLANRERLFEIMLLGRTRIVSGSYVLLRLSAYRKFEAQLCRPSSSLSMMERVAYATEDTLLSYMLAGDGHRSAIVHDEVAWNLPQSFEDIIKQRRRWSNGEVATFLIAWPLIARTPATLLFYAWSLLFYLRVMVDLAIAPTTMFVLYTQGAVAPLVPLLCLYALKIIISIAFFRRPVDGMERVLRAIAHVYCIVHLAGIVLCLLHFAESTIFWALVAVTTVITFFAGFRGTYGRRLSATLSYLVYVLYSRGMWPFISDYSMANFSDVSWGTREVAGDREIYRGRVTSRLARYSELFQHLALLVCFQFIFPVLFMALAHLTSWGWYVFLAVYCFGAFTIGLPTVRRIFYGSHTIDVFVAEPLFDLKDRLMYGAGQTAGQTPRAAVHVGTPLGLAVRPTEIPAVLGGHLSVGAEVGASADGEVLDRIA
ncbi:glycosyltransferase family 2 protein [Myxococcota bacterium]|nr:glycosyltransferase family 2 protein [Myxococcota bacterium]